MNDFNVYQIKQDFIHLLKEKWNTARPLLRLFKTDACGYAYDTGTNKILKCGPIEYHLLENLMIMKVEDALDLIETSCVEAEFAESLKNIRVGIAEKNLFCTIKAATLGSAIYADLEDMIRTSLGMIQLELTERCNLRCRYCVYNPSFPYKRNHGSLDMTSETAFRAIDLLADSSKNKEDVAVTFYGGEPLLQFPLIRSCVKDFEDELGSIEKEERELAEKSNK
jgi:uncharacterized protein